MKELNCRGYHLEVPHVLKSPGYGKVIVDVGLDTVRVSSYHHDNGCTDADLPHILNPHITKQRERSFSKR
jgi:hypothetical protein